MYELSSRIDILKSLTLANIIEDLDDSLSIIVMDERENDIIVRLIPDEHLKFAYQAEVQGLIYHKVMEIGFTVIMKQSEVKDVILDQVSDCDQDTRALLTLEAERIARKALLADDVTHARPSVIKYQMLMELVELLAS